MRSLKSAKYINKSVSKHAGWRMVPSFIKFGSELEPAVSFNIIPLYRPLSMLKLFKFHKTLISTPTDCVYVSLISHGICEVGSTILHLLLLFKHILFQNILIILPGIGSTNNKCSESDVRYYCFESFGLNWRWNLNFMRSPRIRKRIRPIMPHISEQKSSTFVSTWLRLAGIRILLDCPFLPFHIPKIKINKSRPYNHNFKLQKPWNYKFVKFSANQLKLDNLVDFQKSQDFVEAERANNVVTKLFKVLIVNLLFLLIFIFATDHLLHRFHP